MDRVALQLADLSSTLHAQPSQGKADTGPNRNCRLLLERERGNNVARIRNEYEEAQRREKLLEADYSNEARLISEQADSVAHYNILRNARSITASYTTTC